MSHSKKNWTRYQVYTGLQVKCPLYLSYFNERWTLLTDFRKILVYVKLHGNPSSESRVVAFGQKDGQTPLTKLMVFFFFFFLILRMCLKTLYKNTTVQSVARGPCVVRCPILRHAGSALWWNRGLDMWRLDGPWNRTHVFTGTCLSKKINRFQKYWWIAGWGHGGTTITSGVEDISHPNLWHRVMAV